MVFLMKEILTWVWKSASALRGIFGLSWERACGRTIWSLFQYHVKYIHNDIFKPLQIEIIFYVEHIQKMYDLAK